ncbi:hypothetical protein [Dactylosporangium sp. NPDC049140]|uniref:hypothetical protein n=1 Tax=Dactylosporangium sp. NPDC049140 TaxID=3155647 RepID=UPI0033CA05D4
MRSAAVLVTALAVLAGCARPPGASVAAPPTGAPEIHPAWTSCDQVADPGWPDFAAPLGFPRLPADFAPTAVVVCATGPQPRADGGEDMVRLEKHGSDVEALSRALRLPDLPRTAEACTADLPGVVWFAVLDAAGRWLRPGIAGDACGKLRIEVRDAVEHLALTTVHTTVLGETKSSAAASSGCEQRWADMVGAVTAMPGDAPADRPADAPPGPMRLCLYRVPPSEQGSGKPGGDFERGGPLPDQRWTALRAELLTAGATPGPCTTHASRFALFRGPDGRGGEVYAELDGCHRLLFDTPSGSTLRQGTAELAAHIDQAL